jgi:hypothetical protein
MDDLLIVSGHIRSFPRTMTLVKNGNLASISESDEYNKSAEFKKLLNSKRQIKLVANYWIQYGF